MNQSTMSRRSFLQLSAGSIASAALLHMPTLGFAQDSSAASWGIRPAAMKDLPRKAEDAALASPLVKKSYEDILSIAGTIKNAKLRAAVLELVKHPQLRFLERFRSAEAVKSAYAELAAQGLADPAKISAENLLPPTDRPIQAFMTAPGSGYVSHHPYPGGLATHTDVNLHVTQALCRIYHDVFGYDVDYDSAVAAQTLHDIAKPYVFQWQEDGSSRKEYTLAGQGAHRTFSLAEVIYRGFPAETVIAQACAHGAPSSPKEEADVAGWLRAAAILAGTDAAAYGLVNKEGTALNGVHRQEGYIVHLGDHDFVLSGPAAHKSVDILRKVASETYGMSGADLQGSAFNAFRNYAGAQLSFMFLNALESRKDGFEAIAAEVSKVILK